MINRKIDTQWEVPSSIRNLKAIDALMARGFLFEKIGENRYKYAFNRRDCIYYEYDGKKTDLDELSSICEKYDLGAFNKDERVLTIENPNISLLDQLFSACAVSMDVCKSIDQSFSFFLNERPLPRIGVMELDPYIARYVKTLLLCGIRTVYSCDSFGNHDRKHMLHIIFDGSDYGMWHEWVRQHFLDLFGSNSDDFRKWFVPVSKQNYSSVYEKMQKDSSVLFRQRDIIIAIKEAAKHIVKTSNVHSENEQRELFYDSAERIWEKGR